MIVGRKSYHWKETGVEIPLLDQAKQTNPSQLDSQITKQKQPQQNSSVGRESPLATVRWSDAEGAHDGVVVEPGGPVVVAVLVRVNPLTVVPGVQDDVRHQLHDLLVVCDY